MCLFCGSDEPINRFKRKYAGRMMDVECNGQMAKLQVDNFPDFGGSTSHAKRKCILFNDSWITPTEYETQTGFGSRKNWRSSVRMNGRSIKQHIDSLASEAVAEDLGVSVVLFLAPCPFMFFHFISDGESCEKKMVL